MTITKEELSLFEGLTNYDPVRTSINGLWILEDYSFVTDGSILIKAELKEKGKDRFQCFIPDKILKPILKTFRKGKVEIPITITEVFPDDTKDRHYNIIWLSEGCTLDCIYSVPISYKPMNIESIKTTWLVLKENENPEQIIGIDFRFLNNLTKIVRKNKWEEPLAVMEILNSTKGIQFTWDSFDFKYWAVVMPYRLEKLKGGI